MRKKPAIYFVNSMSDMFHEDIPDDYIRQVFDVIKSVPKHTFQILTKRAERMERFSNSNDVPANVWIWVSVENKKQGMPRIECLRNIKARIRFLSREPLLEDLGILDMSDIQWVIVGGESGPKQRQMKQKWVERIKKQCEDFNVSFFFKQWGGWGADGVKRSKKANGRLLLGRTWDSKPALNSPSLAVC